MTNFTIIYIKMGFPRLPLERKVALMPSILQSLEGKPAEHQDSLLMMILPTLHEVKSPSDDPVKKLQFLRLSEKPNLSKFLCEFLLDFLLLPYGSHPSIKPADPNDKIIVPPGKFFKYILFWF